MSKKASSKVGASPKFPSTVIQGAQAVQQKYGVPASVTLAQWAIESSYGQRTPPGSNNPFGIKAKPGEPHVDALTSEHVNGKWITVEAPFRKFDSYDEAFDSRGKLLSSARRYETAMKHSSEPDRFAEEIHKAGYATDPLYSYKLKRIMKIYDLQRFDVAEPTKRDMPTPVKPLPRTVKTSAHRVVASVTQVFSTKIPQACSTCFDPTSPIFLGAPSLLPRGPKQNGLQPFSEPRGNQLLQTSKNRPKVAQESHTVDSIKGNEALSKAAKAGISNPHIEKARGWCSRFVRQVTETVYGKTYSKLFGVSAKSTYNKFKQNGRLLDANAPIQPGDILFQPSLGKYGHVGIYVGDGKVAENSYVHHGANGGKGYRTLKEFGAYQGVGRLP